MARKKQKKAVGTKKKVSTQKARKKNAWGTLQMKRTRKIQKATAKRRLKKMAHRTGKRKKTTMLIKIRIFLFIFTP